MKVTQYFPAFFEGFDKTETEVSTLRELLALDFIAHSTRLDGFYRFSLSRNTENDFHLLLAEFDAGRRWHVIARLEGKDLDPFRGLPNFDPPK